MSDHRPPSPAHSHHSQTPSHHSSNRPTLPVLVIPGATPTSSRDNLNHSSPSNQVADSTEGAISHEGPMTEGKSSLEHSRSSSDGAPSSETHNLSPPTGYGASLLAPYTYAPTSSSDHSHHSRSGSGSSSFGWSPSPSPSPVPSDAHPLSTPGTTPAGSPKNSPTTTKPVGVPYLSVPATGNTNAGGGGGHGRIPSLSLSVNEVPPSPTWSHVSSSTGGGAWEGAPTSLALRDNKLDPQGNKLLSSSPGALSPDSAWTEHRGSRDNSNGELGIARNHSRRPSVNTLESVGEREDEDVAVANNESSADVRVGTSAAAGVEGKKDRERNLGSPETTGGRDTTESGPSAMMMIDEDVGAKKLGKGRTISKIPLIGSWLGGGGDGNEDEGAEGDGGGKKKKKKKKKDADEEEEEDKKEEEPPLPVGKIPDLSPEDMLPFPLAFTPVVMNGLVDPKSFENLASIGGEKGLLKGLGTDRENGLDIVEEHKDETSGSSPLNLGKKLAALPVSSGNLSLPNKKKRRNTSDLEGQPSKVPPPPVPAKNSAPPDSRVGTPELVKKDFETVGEREDDGGGGGEPPSYTEATKDDRVRVYGINRVPDRKSKSLFSLMWAALKDKVLVLLSIAAVVSLALGLYQDLGTPPTYYRGPGCPPPPAQGCAEPQVDWVEGVAIMAAIAIVVLVGSVNDYQKEKQFRALNSKKEDRTVKCIRSGRQQVISVYSVVVGDILELEPGEILPVDGVFLSGHNVKCDESGATGETDLIRKCSYSEMVEKKAKGTLGSHEDCFLLSGSKVQEGVGSYVVIAVGQYSFHGRIMMSLRTGSEDTPLQLKLNRLAELIAKLGSLAGALLFGVLMIRFFVELKAQGDRSANDKAQNFIQILIIAVTIIVVAVPEGLPLAVTLALAFATRRMTKQNLLVRVLGSCETMAHSTVICTDKTGTLTQNKMTVVAGSVGVHFKFAHRLEQNQQRTNANDDVDASRAGHTGDESDGKSTTVVEESPAVPQIRKGRLDFSVDMTDVAQRLSPGLQNLFNDSIAINSTAFEGTDENGDLTFIGSKTETALLDFAKARRWKDYNAVRKEAEIVQMVPFSSERKAMGVVVRLPDGNHRLYIKGASEVLTKVCSGHVQIDEKADPSSNEVKSIPFNEETRTNINRTIIFYASQSLRTIALCYRDLPSKFPFGAAGKAGEHEQPYEDLAQNLTLLAVTAIEDPLRDGVTDAVATCHSAGVAVKMCTGDNVLTARSIAAQCGIYTPGGVIMEGPVFRKLSEKDMNTVIPRLQVLARSSPEDKKTLVEHLKKMGEVVGVTGDGTNDGPALKTANVGFSMGIAGTEVAKEASDIILMDDNFASIVSAIMWGRCVNDSVKKFIQFQISVNIVAVVITFVSSVASSDEQSVLTAVQLLWVNLIMDTFAALALATDPASPEVLDRKPDSKFAPLISVDMWKMITVQATYQTIVALVLHFAGKSILGMHGQDYQATLETTELSTLVFNAFVFCQIFNQLNCRRLDRGFNIFSGFWRNWYFMLIFMIMVGGQILIVEVGGAAFQVRRIGGRDWGISIVIGAISLPIAVLVKLIPSAPIERWMIKWRLLPDPNTLGQTAPEKTEEQWNEGITKVIDNLSTFGQIRGGRMRSSSIVRKSRTAMLKEHDIHPGSLMAMVPSLVMSSVGAGWKPESGSLSDPASLDPSKSTKQLFKHGIQVHPETDQSDPLVDRFKPPPSAAPSIRSPPHSRQNSTGSKRHSRNESRGSLQQSRSRANSQPPLPPSPDPSSKK